ncbi:MAG: FHA domain-containing protein [Streptosporangiales bacterium]|nr:FHA domain-containing protein [Streptosporangiales bacterium]
MGVQGSIPPVRASDADRERAVKTLQDRSMEGRLSHETFVGRVGHALRAKSRRELTDLLDDLPPRRRITGRLLDGVAALSAFTARVEAAWREPRLPRLALPDPSGGGLVIGRDPACDLTVSDSTVSRLHAELRWRDGEWVLADLGSRNGTRVNGWRLVGPQTIRPGDRVAFGRASFRISAAHPRP